MLKRLLLACMLAMVVNVADAAIYETNDFILTSNNQKEQFSTINIPSSVEEIAAIVAEKMEIKDYPLPVVKDMNQTEFNFSHWKESNHENTINATWPRFFYQENVINYSFKWPLDRLAHEIVHYFQQFSGIDMDHEDIYYDLEQQASEIQLWFREHYSHGF